MSIAAARRRKIQPRADPPRSPTLPAARTAASCPGSLQRVRQMQALREQGWSLDEIALRFGVSRERVRQILRAHGGPDPEDIAEARRRRAEAQAEARIDELLALWRAGDAAAQRRQRARPAGRRLPQHDRALRDRRRPAPRAGPAWPARAARRRTPTATSSSRCASVAARARPRPERQGVRAARARAELPSLPTVLNRMGGWTRAAARRRHGRRSAPPTPRAHAPLDRRGVLGGAARASSTSSARSRRCSPTSATPPGRPELPSSATLRNRLGRWSSITTQLAARARARRQRRRAGAPRARSAGARPRAAP